MFRKLWTYLIIWLKRLGRNSERGKKLFLDAVVLLDGPEPKSHTDCEFCNYAKLFDE